MVNLRWPCRSSVSKRRSSSSSSPPAPFVFQAPRVSPSWAILESGKTEIMRIRLDGNKVSPECIRPRAHLGNPPVVENPRRHAGLCPGGAEVCSGRTLPASLRLLFFFRSGEDVQQEGVMIHHRGVRPGGLTRTRLIHPAHEDGFPAGSPHEFPLLRRIDDDRENTEGKGGPAATRHHLNWPAIRLWMLTA